MAIRNGHRKGDNLACDDYTGFVVYASQLRQDEYGFYAKEPDIVNQQKYIRSYGDPYPLDFIRPDGDQGIAVLAPPSTVGLTSVVTNPNSYGYQVLTSAS